jgi:crotonobetainyl-CoA:carnitine CoA-transferase CaiB-like acyl-CoA transferase
LDSQVVLNFSQAEDRKTFLKLVETADVVIEGFRPGALDKFGLSPTDLLKFKPSLIVCSISGFGQTGPLSKCVSACCCCSPVLRI